MFHEICLNSSTKFVEKRFNYQSSVIIWINKSAAENVPLNFARNEQTLKLVSERCRQKKFYALFYLSIFLRIYSPFSNKNNWYMLGWILILSTYKHNYINNVSYQYSFQNFSIYMTSLLSRDRRCLEMIIFFFIKYISRLL